MVEGLIGKKVSVFYDFKYHYGGILLELTEVTLMLKDDKEGLVILPLDKCQIKEAR